MLNDVEDLTVTLKSVDHVNTKIDNTLSIYINITILGMKHELCSKKMAFT